MLRLRRPATVDFQKNFCYNIYVRQIQQITFFKFYSLLDMTFSFHEKETGSIPVRIRKITCLEYAPVAQMVRVHD